VEAAKWYLLARAQGEKDAWLDLFLKHLPAADLEKAKALAAAFRPTKMRQINTTTGGKTSLPRGNGRKPGGNGAGNGAKAKK